jgi:hypothetical protein
MSALPTRTDISGSPSNATAKAALSALYDFTAQRLAPGTSGAGTASAAEMKAARQGLGCDAPLGQCRLQKSGANLVLSRFQGRYITIDGTPQEIPAAGVSLAPTGLVVSTLYYVYAWMNAGVMTLEASTTGHTTDATTGVEIKTGDATRTLVGMARPITGPAFNDTNLQRFVRSWFNDPGICGFNGSSSNTAFATAPYAEISSAFRAEFLQWAGEQLSLMATGVCFDTSAFGGTMYLGVAVDSTVSPVGARGIANITSAGYGHQLAASFAGGVGEGYHYTTLLGGQTGCTAPNYSGTTLGILYSLIRK